MMIKPTQALIERYISIISKTHEGPLITLNEAFCSEHLKCRKTTAYKKAAAQNLPFPVIKVGEGTCEYAVAIEQLAEWFAKRSIAAQAEWDSVQRGAA